MHKPKNIIINITIYFLFFKLTSDWYYLLEIFILFYYIILLLF